MHGRQRRFQQPENGIVGGVVEVSPSDDSFHADSRERINQEPESLHGDATPGLRLGCSPVLGWVMVHQHGEGAVIPGLTGNLLEEGDRCPIGVGHDGRSFGHDWGTGSSEHAQQNIPRGHDRVRSKEVAGFGIEKFHAG